MAQPVNWRQVSDRDLSAAHAFLVENHPGAHPDLGDTVFQRVLADAYRVARGLLPQVTDAAGYRAALRRFATAIGDPHVSVSFADSLPAAAWRWPGFTTRYVGGRFQVATVDSSETRITPGDVLLSCDGVPIANYAQRRLGRYRAAWHIEADVTRAAFYLLLDDGNPFETVPRSCLVRSAQGGRRRLHLDWRPTDAAPLSKRLSASVSFLGSRSIGITMRDRVYWIALDHLGPEADSMLRALPPDSLRQDQAGVIVIDLRGNGGGSSSKGDSLIAALFGQQALTTSQRALSNGSGYAWRASPFVEQSLRQFAADRATRYGAASAEAQGWSEEADSVAQAIAKGAAFWPALPPDRRPTTPNEWRPTRATGRLRKTVVLTDHLCFSSCLMLVAQLRALGALHIGGTTSASRRYMEVRRAPLPSGFASFSTLQKVAFGAPDWLGPFRPDRLFPSTVTSSSDAERWVTETALRHATTGR